MVASGVAQQRITAMWHVRRDDDDIAGAEQVLLTVAYAARLSFHNRANRQLRVAMAFIRLRTLPGAAQFQPAMTGKSLLYIARSGHGIVQRDLGFYITS